MWGSVSSEDKIVNKDISGYKVFNDKHSKAEKDEEGLFNVEEHDLEVESLQDGYSTEKKTVTEGSGYDEGIVDKDVELKTVCEDDLGKTNCLDEEGSIPKVLKRIKKQVGEEIKTKVALRRFKMVRELKRS